MLVILAVAQPSTQIIASADFNDLCAASRRLGKKLLLELLVGNVNGHNDHEDRFLFNAAHDFIVALNYAISLLL